MNDSGGIIRIKKQAGDYFIAPKEPFSDPALSWGARGLLAFIMAHKNKLPILSAKENLLMNELIKAGYIDTVGGNIK